MVFCSLKMEQPYTKA